ncbi:nucleotidyltransferase family protein [Ideonella livida]|uniref:NTP transferase domain-containing protein n=1 Tax=Ideonella livida TaxID=2707176 RepID=A0A7C9TM90_9BURK|nr:NTP transferase domain-containing protein [Ideonella livida]NDY93142.1 NTP transferase domain-containing protein [Ideonella livida]
MTLPVGQAVAPAEVRAVILAAGLGSRLGGVPKAALRHAADGQTLLARHAQALRSAGVAEVSAVIGPYRERLLPLAQAGGITPLLHTLDGPSLIDSQRLALAAHAAAAAPHASLLLLVSDLPHLSAEHLAPLLAAWAQRPAGVHALMPVVHGQRGHPVLLSPTAVVGVLAQPPDAGPAGVRAWLAAHPQAVQALPLSDPAYVQDVDTLQDVALHRLALP